MVGTRRREVEVLRRVKGLEASAQINQPTRAKRKISEFVQQLDPKEKLDPDVEDILLEIADDFVEQVTTFACKLARHRKSRRVELKDIQMPLEKNWNIRIPGFSADSPIRSNSNKKTNLNTHHTARVDAVRKSAKEAQVRAGMERARAQFNDAEREQGEGAGGPMVVNIHGTLVNLKDGTMSTHYPVQHVGVAAVAVGGTTVVQGQPSAVTVVPNGGTTTVVASQTTVLNPDGEGAKVDGEVGEKVRASGVEAMAVYEEGEAS
ncbi:transcription initiation factor TFIID subunit A-domain-containing protein [Cladochytrium replicatum]|nr:transcription initiation factor TFIID subunit A-domain-containing protein [Cladochytrium replicatum]